MLLAEDVHNLAVAVGLTGVVDEPDEDSSIMITNRPGKQRGGGDKSRLIDTPVVIDTLKKKEGPKLFF